MEKKYILVYTYMNNNSSVESFVSNVLSFDEMMSEYMESFFMDEDLKNMSNTELENKIISWEHIVQNNSTSPIKIYEMDEDGFHTKVYSTPLKKMVEHVKKQFNS